MLSRFASKGLKYNPTATKTLRYTVSDYLKTCLI